jgi:hypothetical protein
MRPPKAAVFRTGLACSEQKHGYWSNLIRPFIKKTQKTPRRLIELALQRAELVQ